jgi:WD40 repeat protein
VLANGQVVSGSDDNTLKVWDVKTGECVKILKGHFGSVSCVAVLANGQMVSGSYDNTLKVWDAQTGECVKTLEWHVSSVFCVTALANGQVVSGSRDKTLKVWDVERGECVKILEGHHGLVACVAVLANGQVVSGSWDKTLKVWSWNTLHLSLRPKRDLRSLKIVGRTLFVKVLEVTRENCEALGSFLKTPVVCRDRKTLEIRCTTDKDVICWLQLLIGGKITPSGRLQAILNQPQFKSLMIKDCEVVETLAGEMGALKTLHLENTNLTEKNILDVIHHAPWLKRLDLGYHPKITLSDTLNAKLSYLEHLTIGILMQDKLSQSSRALVVDILRQRFPQLKGSRLNGGTTRLESTLTEHSGLVNCVAALLINGQMISGLGNGTLKVWDAKTGECLKTLVGHRNSVNCIAMLSNGEVVSGSDDKTLKVSNVDTSACLKTLEGHRGVVNCVTALANGQVVSGSYDKTLKIWNVEIGTCLKTLEEHRDEVLCVGVLANGQVISGSKDNTLKVWDVETGACLKTLEGHGDSVLCVAVLPNGQVVSGSYDKTLKIWDAKMGTCLKTLEGHRNSVNCIAVLTNGQVVSGSADGALKIWDVETATCSKILEHDICIHSLAMLGSDRVVSSSGNTLKIWSLSFMVLGFEDFHPHQPAAFKRLFFAPFTPHPKDEARYHLFGFFSTRDKQSFGCVSKACYAVQQYLEAAVDEKSLEKK